MSGVIKLRKGLDLRLEGQADRRTVALPLAQAYAVTPADFEGVTPKLLVQPGEQVKAGAALLFDKARPEVLFTSPVSGTVADIVRGEKRRILAVVVEPDGRQESETFATDGFRGMERAQVVELLLRSGLWPMVIQRPYGIIADPADTPKAIFISGFDSAPLAPDMDYVLAGEMENLAAGIDALRKLTAGQVHLGLAARRKESCADKALACAARLFPACKPASHGEHKDILGGIANAEKHYFSGPHPAGNVGVQIHHIDPVGKGEKVWTVDVQAAAIIGRFFRTGRLDMTKTVALTGSEVSARHYCKVIAGARMDSIVERGNVCSQELYLRGDWSSVRIISGNVLTGRRVERDGYLGFYANQVTVIPEGDRQELLGWAMPRLDKFSVSRAYFSWLMPWKRYTPDTNLNGGERAYVFTGLYDRYLPMDIYPMYLLKAILAGDIDKMENLGIYEVVEEDFALCEYVDPSKTDMQQTIRDGINLMIKEL